MGCSSPWLWHYNRAISRVEYKESEWQVWEKKHLRTRVCLCEWTRKSWTAKQVKLIWQACCLEFSLKNNNFYIYIFSSCVSMSEGSSGKPFSLLIFWYTFRENYEFKVAWKLGSKSVQMPLTDSSTCMKWKNSTSLLKNRRALLNFCFYTQVNSVPFPNL